MNNLNYSSQKIQDIFQNQEVEKYLYNPLFNKDIWNLVDDLGLQILEHCAKYTLNFERLDQDWLKLLAKLYCFHSRRHLKAYTLLGRLVSIKKFSDFIKATNNHSFCQIDNQILDEFDYYLHSQKLSDSTITHSYSHLAIFFDTCRREGWLDVNTYWFKNKRYNVQLNHDKIDYLPEEIWNQFQENIYLLPEEVQRMVLVIRTTGLRIGELLNLPLDCLRNRNNQWRLRLKETEKYEIEDELPINIIELVTVIKEQQNYIKRLFGDSYNKLFCSNTNKRQILQNGQWEFYKPIPRVMSSCQFNMWLNLLAKKANIRSKDGELWHFKSHQFRKTVATVMTNAGIRDLIIQKYLRHRSPDMQRYYKHLIKQVLGMEYQELIKEKKYVDITGKVVSSHQPTNPMTEILRRRMYQITTQYGECHRPILKKPCQTVNACWRCKEWRVSSDDLAYLKEDLKRVESELDIAQSLGMIRQQQGLEDDLKILKNCIQGLETISD
jgi:integrase/recombinase XerD